jgi:hypothetical protein
VGLGGDFDFSAGLRGEDRGEAEDEENAAHHGGDCSIGAGLSSRARRTAGGGCPYMSQRQ